MQVPGWLVQAELLPAWREPVRVPERAVQAEQTARAERVEAAPAGAERAGSEQPEPEPPEAVQQYAVH